MKLSDTMATPIEEKLDQNLKVSETKGKKVVSLCFVCALFFITHSFMHSLINTFNRCAPAWCTSAMASAGPSHSDLT